MQTTTEREKKSSSGQVLKKYPNIQEAKTVSGWNNAWLCLCSTLIVDCYVPGIARGLSEQAPGLFCFEF